MKVAHFGTFDVENYGDLLFPLIVERRLSNICKEFVHVSPVGGPPVWGDCVRSVAVEELMREALDDVGGVVIGGGNIVHASPGTVEFYDSGETSSSLAYPSLWLGAAYIAARDDLPVCWNGPGVPRAFEPVAAGLLRWTASVSDYMSVRDRYSRRLLEEAGVLERVEVVPDTALEVSKLWTEGEISEAYAEAFSERGRRVPGRSLAFHLNSRYVNEDLGTVASRLDRICKKLDATAILIAMAPCHGDDRLQREVGLRMGTGPLVIDRPQSLREVAACIARSEAYLGSSLHGMITACSFGRRGMLVASEQVAGFKKFTGFLEQFHLSSWLSESWVEAEQRIDDLFATPASIWKRTLEAASPVLDQHWERVQTALISQEGASHSGAPREAPQEDARRHAIEQLKDIGVNHSGAAIFQGILAENLNMRTAALREKEKEASELKRQLADLRRSREQERRRFEEQIETLESERDEERRRFEEVNQGKDRHLSELGRQAEQRSQEVETLERWVEELDVGISALLDSRRWKTGQTLGELHRKVTRRPLGLTAQDYLVDVLRQFRNWKESRKLERVGAEDVEEKESSEGPSDSPATEVPAPTSGRKPNDSIPAVAPSNAGPERGWRFRNRPKSRKTKTKVSVISWDMTHNPVGRAYLIADALSRKFDVEIVGARFAMYGAEIWEPLRRDGKIPTIDFVGQTFPTHFAEMDNLAQYIDGDVIFVSKPRLPSYELGILAKRVRNRPLILDVDDHELSFFGTDEGLTLDGIKELQNDRGDFLNPYGKLWTRYCESIIPHADHLTVSNVELQKKYGGTVFPHVRDERKFDPALYDRDSIRAKFGFTSEDKVVLFIGTPRLHKGIIEIAKALEKIGNPRYKLCVIGTVVDPDLRVRLERLKGDHVRLFENQPYSDLPANLSIGDLVCLLQDRESRIAKYQMPAKFTDALAMEIPILATDVPPLANLTSLGLVESLGRTSLDQKIDEIFSNYAPFKRKAVANRKVFLQEYSYATAAEKIEEAILPLLGETPPIPEEFERLQQFHRETFSTTSNSATGRVTEKPQRRAPSQKLEPQNPAVGRQVVATEKKSRYVDDKYDIVFFWKQNDTSIYGRRQDMLVKYLSKSPKVNRIVHLDAPIEITALLSLLKRGKVRKANQSHLVFSQTLSRLLGRQHSEKVRHYTFVYAARSSTVGRMARLLPKQGDYLNYLRNVLKENRIGDRKTIFWVCPVNLDFPKIALALDPDLIVADVIDDHRTWHEPGSDWFEKISRNYEEILGMSELVIANCQPVKQSMFAYADEIHMIPNAAEPPDTAEIPQARPKELRRMKGPILGYVGNLSSRIDIDLLEYVATARPGWNIVLIGSSHLSRDILRLDVYDNIHFLGVKRYSEVRQYIGNFDVAIIPHVDDKMTRSMNPLKLFVYASMDVPIVSTNIANLNELRELVHVVLNKEDFVRKVEAILHEGKTAPSDERMRLLKQNSWDERVDTILKLIDKKAPTDIGGE